MTCTSSAERSPLPINVGMVDHVRLPLLSRNNTPDDTDPELEDVGDENLSFTHATPTVPLDDKKSKFTAVPRQRGKEEATPAERKAKMIVYGMLAALPVSLIAMVAALAGMAIGGGGDDTSDDTVTTTTDTRFEAAAEMVVIDWLAGRDSIIPLYIEDGQPFSELRRPLNPEGDSEQRPPVAIPYESLGHVGVHRYTVTSDETPVEVHTFVIRQDSGAMFDIIVPIIDNNGPALAGYPSLQPSIVGDSLTNRGAGLDWSAIFTGQELTERAIGEVERWATAYVANDTATLYSVTGDTEANDYTGLGGWTLNSTPVIQHTAVFQPEDEQYGLATVILDMSTVNNPDIRLTVSYDVLITNLEQAAPNIAAWGPIGTGYTLRPFINGIPEPEEGTATTTASTIPPEGANTPDTTETEG